MERSVFDQFRELIYANSGISLNPGKEALVSARIGKRVRSLGLPDGRAYLEYVRKDNSGDEMVQLLDQISTNVTSFFRESAHFDFLRRVLCQWSQRGQRRFRIWSAACSTGEEPYSLAITVQEALGAASGHDVRILATDISTRVLAHCRAGVYDAERIRPVEPRLIDRYFQPVSRADRSAAYEARPALRQLISFGRLNLSVPPFPMRGPFDIVFCRNVMIYFDNVVRRQLLLEINRLLRPGGYLMVGHAESLTGLVSDFKPVAPSIFIRN